MKEIARKYGIEVTDGADRGIRAMGILGGISEKMRQQLSRRDFRPKTKPLKPDLQ